MKQSDRIVKKGDYYELENTQETIYQQRQIKKQEIPSSLSIPGADQIISEIPTYAQARSNYFFTNTKRVMNKCGYQDLQEELREMLSEELDNTIKKQILDMINQIQIEKQQNIIKLNELSKNQKINQNELKNPKELKLILELNLGDLEERLKKLQEFNYPQISQIENIIEIMLGQKNANTPALSSLANNYTNLDSKTKQEIQSLYSHYNTLTCLNNLYGLIQDIHHNDNKYVQMSAWVKKAEIIAEMNKDFKMQLNADLQLVQELQKNFKENVQNLKVMLDGYRKKIAEAKNSKK